MANRPANAGAHSAGPQQGMQQGMQQGAQQGAQQATPQGPAAAPPPVHHQDFPRGRRAAPAQTAPAHAAPAQAVQAAKPASPVVAWLPYLIVFAGTVAGLIEAWLGSRHAGRGAAVVGAALLVAALARLALPPRYAGLLASRSKAQDVAAFAVLGAAVLGVAASLP
jgi:Protein of unknown function (DUF3017)